MDLKNKFILKFAIGFSLGMLVCTIITSVITTNVINDGNTYFCDPSFIDIFGNEIIAFIIQMIISGLYGAICIGGTVVYEIEEWSILKVTIIHFSITVSSFFITATILKWWPNSSFIDNIIFIGIIVIMYMFIWLIQYISYKIEVKKIKKEIKEFNKNNTK